MRQDSGSDVIGEDKAVVVITIKDGLKIYVGMDTIIHVKKKQKRSGLMLVIEAPKNVRIHRDQDNENTN
jgi:sRNA-binding carbon storage regulator CsrA